MTEDEKDEVGTEDKELLKEALARFKLSQEAWGDQFKAEADDLRFQVPDKQWDDDVRREREGGNESPPRPILSVTKIHQPIQLVLNQERSARLSVNISPLSPDANPEVAKILEGIYRRIERDSQANVARSWAFTRATMAGRGCYRIVTAYDDDGGDDFDQSIRIERILRQQCVYFDPAAQKADFSDGEFVFITTWMPLKTFRREFPDASKDSEGETLEWSDLAGDMPDWVRGDGETAAIQVAEYFYKHHEPKKLTGKTRDGKTVTRTKDVVTVRVCKITGREILEKGETNGKYLLVIPVHGQELQSYDEKRHWVGMIGPAKDAQRGYNHAITSAVETAAMEPKAPWVAYAEQLEGYENEWKSSNLKNYSVLFHKVVQPVPGGPFLPPPTRTQVDVGKLGLSLQLAQTFDGAIQATTSTFSPSLGRGMDRQESGRKVAFLQQQADSSNSHFIANLADSMVLEAKAVLDLIPAIYDRPGRIARILDEEGESSTILLNQRFYTNPKTKQPVPLKDGEMPPPMPMPGGMGQPGQSSMGGPGPMGRPPMGPGMPPGGPPQPMGAPMGPGMTSQPSPQQQPAIPPKVPEVKFYDLRKGIYSVGISIGKQRQTAMQEGREEIGAILEAHPELMPLIGPTFLRYSDWPGAKEMADILTKVRDKQFPGITGKDDEDGPSPEQAAAQLQQATQQIQILQQQLGAAAKALETEQAQQQATLEKARMDNETKVRIAEMQQQTAVVLQRMEAQLAELKLALEAREAEKERAHETVMAVAGPMLEPPEAPERPEGGGGE